ncbi:MAG TPA: c-type cytochrome [Chitinophagales bacterium]|jgi:hypothetical protein|nr:c-type cytochrome [Chitinophagales bacterium]MBP6154306.1 c-type cytochrome [Chitinophagales bacterium]HQV77209.1 c-type cytochrome [Chitinophagales bacterium]HQW79708.1 c-type cytochrome [Chitinophagales bacterium]HRB19192.1 c-type cytochrome [Chitinophagales bacterium]
MRNYKILFAFCLFLSILILSSFTTDTTKEGEKSTWKNVQLLPQTLTQDEMDAIMDAWSSSLGVNCSHCHVRGDMASDEKENKIIARKMLTMTNEINEKYFGKDSGTISCMTCHNGKAHP